MPDPVAPLVSITDLTKTLPGGRQLFAGLALHLDPGEVVAITGASGIGKSTLLNLIAGLDHADQGRILIGGEPMLAQDERGSSALRRRALGFVFQAFHILPHLTLTRNVAVPLLLLGQEAQPALAQADMALAAVGLGGRGADFADMLSGGELQRVAVARALVHRPSVILADEPTGNLDPETADRIMILMAEQVRARGAALLLVTHSARAAAVADRHLVLSPTGLAPG